MDVDVESRSDDVRCDVHDVHDVPGNASVSEEMSRVCEYMFDRLAIVTVLVRHNCTPDEFFQW